MPKRFQTYFGIPVPPWKEQNAGAGCTSIRFVLIGSVPSKKNNLMSVVVRKDAADFLIWELSGGGSISKSKAKELALKAIKMTYSKIRPNKRYAEFVEKQKTVIEHQMKIWSERLQDKGLIFPLKQAALTLRFYFNHQHVQDTVNKQQSIQDLLQECGVIANDDYLTLNPINSSSACYYEEITDTITFITLSFQL